ncbi:hypothetical protein [Streptomyces sp. NPDC097619]|uniref:hypothetical protein n=1 Tax=Streptomyces sp. NPDC097619 TaxID=3157228 RepID=UPI00332FD8D6
MLPKTTAALLASRPENATAITVPSLAPGADAARAFLFGKNTRSKISGWTQKVLADQPLCKAKGGSAVRLLALVLATRTDAGGLLGAGAGVRVSALNCIRPVREAAVSPLPCPAGAGKEPSCACRTSPAV